MSRARSLRVTKECQPQGHGPPSRADNLNCIWATPESCSKSRSGPRPESHWHAAAGVTGLRDGHIHCSWSNLNRGRQRPSPAATGRRRHRLGRRRAEPQVGGPTPRGLSCRLQSVRLGPVSGSRPLAGGAEGASAAGRLRRRHQRSPHISDVRS